MNDEWSDAVLKVSVAAYIEMQRNERAGRLVVPKQHCRKLARRFGRSENVFENLMQNISYVFSLMGRAWLPGLRPTTNVDANVAARIEKFLGQLEGQKAAPVAAFEIAAREETGQKDAAPPTGNPNPKSRRVAITQFERDAAVKGWVLRRAAGICECCEKPAPFNSADGLPYLELHYVRQLIEGGADTVSNAVALCPNCHSEIHHGANAQALAAWLYDNVDRLMRE